MPYQQDLRKRPSCYLTADGHWPDGPLESGSPGVARLAQAISRRLRHALQGQVRRAVARDARLDRRTIRKLMDGESWGRAPTIARLEGRLQTRLWGDEHLRPDPRSYINSGEWPDGQLRMYVPPEVDLLRALVLRLREECKNRNLKQVAETAKVSVHTLEDLIDGTYWGDLTTIARLERRLGTRLWGDEHRSSSHPRDQLRDGNWPEGRLEESARPEVRLAQGLALRLHIVCSKSSPEAVARKAAINPIVVQSLLDGTAWANFNVIARLEKTTGTTLWGREQFGPVRYRTIKEEKHNMRRPWPN